MLVTDAQFNIGHICTRLQCELGHSDKLAMRWLRLRGEQASFTSEDLDRQSSRCAKRSLKQ
jgi:acetyl-CoA synthetase